MVSHLYLNTEYVCIVVYLSLFFSFCPPQFCRKPSACVMLSWCGWSCVTETTSAPLRDWQGSPDYQKDCSRSAFNGRNKTAHLKPEHSPRENHQNVYDFLMLMKCRCICKYFANICKYCKYKICIQVCLEKNNLKGLTLALVCVEQRLCERDWLSDKRTQKRTVSLKST